LGFAVGARPESRERALRLTEVQLGIFKKAYVGAYESLNMRAGWIPSDRANTREFATAQAALMDNPTWQDLKLKLVAREFVNFLSDEDLPFNPNGISVRICARVALAVATGDSSLLRPGEEELMEKARVASRQDAAPVVPGEPALPPPPVARPGEIVVIDTAFLATRPRRALARRSYLKAFTPVLVRIVDRAATEIQFRLRRPDGDGWIDVIRYEGGLYRPLTAPRSWEPISVERFLAAMQTGEAWRDNPALEREDRNATRVLMDVNDAADIAPGTRSEIRAAEERRAQIVERCTGLVSIGGIVHRPTPVPPELRLVVRPEWEDGVPCPPDSGYRPIRLAWECGALTSWSDPHPYGPTWISDEVHPGEGLRAFPITFEPTLRALATGMGDPNLKPIATNADFAPFPEPSLLQMAWIPGAYVKATKKICGRREHTAAAAASAAATFATACNSDDLAAAQAAATAMSCAALELAAASSMISLRDGVFHPLWPEEAYIDSARGATTALVLATEAKRIVEALMGLDDDAALLAAAFA